MFIILHREWARHDMRISLPPNFARAKYCQMVRNEQDLPTARFIHSAACWATALMAGDIKLSRLSAKFKAFSPYSSNG